MGQVSKDTLRGEELGYTVGATFEIYNMLQKSRGASHGGASTRTLACE